MVTARQRHYLLTQTDGRDFFNHPYSLRGTLIMIKKIGSGGTSGEPARSLHSTARKSTVSVLRERFVQLPAGVTRN